MPLRPSPHRDLRDADRVPGFTPSRTIRGIFGDPQARVIPLTRRPKQPSAAPVAGPRAPGTIGGRAASGTCPVGICASISSSICQRSCEIPHPVIVSNSPPLPRELGDAGASVGAGRRDGVESGAIFGTALARSGPDGNGDGRRAGRAGPGAGRVGRRCPRAYGLDRKTVRAWRTRGHYAPRSRRPVVSQLDPYEDWLARVRTSCAAFRSDGSPPPSGWCWCSTARRSRAISSSSRSA